MEALSISNWLSIIGFPSIFAIVVYCVKLVREYRAETQEHKNELEGKVDLLMTAYQAQMRDRLFQSYQHHMEQGWISLDELSNWESSYEAYHSLGKNGVMTAKREELLKLPNTKP